MHDRLKAFLAEVASDADRLAAFITDPAKSLEESGFSEDERAAILPGTLFDERLVCVGTGIRTIGQMTMEAIAWIKRADKVLYLVGDPAAEAVITALNPTAESLYSLYAENKPRLRTYEEMVETILGHVREDKVVCVALYGHPGVFAYAAHEAIRRARAAGHKARMLPGVSAEDCLFADLGLDPGRSGCQSYEATDFLINGRVADPSTPLILWQIGVMGDTTYKRGRYDVKGMPQLIAKLLQYYPPMHMVYVYEASLIPGAEPSVQPVPLYLLAQAARNGSSTLFIPPSMPPRVDLLLTHQLGLLG